MKALVPRTHLIKLRVLTGTVLCLAGLCVALAGLNQSLTGEANLSSVALKATTVVQGVPSLGTITLDAPAPAGGANIGLTSLNSAVATVPGSATVPEGATSTTFVVTTLAVTTPTQVTIQASYNGVTISPTVNVTPRIPVRGVTGDLWADVIVGKADFSEFTPNHGQGNAGLGPNAMESISGVALAGDQLIVSDGSRMLFWNGLDALTNGRPADGLVGDPEFSYSGQCCGQIKTDSINRLWVQRADRAGIDLYQLPLTAGASPIASVLSPNLTLPVLGGGSLTLGPVDGLALVGQGDFVWVSDVANNRVLRIRNPLVTPMVDVVLGQTDTTGNLCNRGLVLPPNTGTDQVATADMICSPGSLAIDRNGNFYVSDASAEGEGNWRLLLFHATQFPTDTDNVATTFAPSADKIFPYKNAQPGITWEPAFDSSNRMVVGYNGYLGGPFVGVYQDPLGPETNPDEYLNDYGSQPVAMAFDRNDNLYVGDRDQMSVLIYSNPLGPGGSAAINTSPTSLMFSPQLVGTQSDAKPVTLMNTGSAKLTISSIATSGDFHQTNTCGTSVAAGANCVVNVTFTPTKEGTRTGALTITDSATGNPHLVTLTGIGAPDLRPTLLLIAPDNQTAGNSDFLLTIGGLNFVDTSVVQWNGSPRATTYVTATILVATITAADIANAGTSSVTVMNPPPGGGTSNSLPFTTNNPAPTVASLSPDSETAGDSAFTLTVTGTNFVSTSVVQWNGSARPTTLVSDTTVTAAISAADIANGETVLITVNNPAPGGGTSKSENFTINNPEPNPTTLSPDSAIAGGSQFTLTVNGTNFVPSSVVKWKNTSLTTTFINSTQITAIVPASDIATAGTAMVKVTNPGPGGGTSDSLTFTINNPVPTATALTPSNTLAGAGAFTLRVTGTNFVATSKVQWNAHNRTTTFVNSTTLNASILDGDVDTAGTATVTVFNPTPGGGTSNGLSFTVNNPVPNINNLSPNNALAGGSQFSLTVNGTNFVKGSAVNWNGSALGNTHFVSSTQVTVTVPAANIANAGTASVTVTNPAPGGGTSNAVTFAINNPVPNLTSLNPSSKNHGATDFTLAVHGTGFVSTSQVKWKGSNRATTFVSKTLVQAAITAADIANPGTAQVTVVNPVPGGGTSNALSFTIN